jgi:hypothetical protein
MHREQAQARPVTKFKAGIRNEEVPPVVSSDAVNICPVVTPREEKRPAPSAVRELTHRGAPHQGE